MIVVSWVFLFDFDRFCCVVFLVLGVNVEIVDVVICVMMYGMMLGVDSYGVWLLLYYLIVLQGGWLNLNLQLKKFGGFGVVEVWDVDYVQGVVGVYCGMVCVIELVG